MSKNSKLAKKGNENLESWLLHQLNPRIDFTIHEFEWDGAQVVFFVIQVANSSPVRFSGEAYVRVGSYKKKLKDFPEKERRLWQILSEAPEDWSAQIGEGANFDELDPNLLQEMKKTGQISPKGTTRCASGVYLNSHRNVGVQGDFMYRIQPRLPEDIDYKWLAYT